MKENNDEIDIQELFNIVWGKRLFILIFTSAAAIISISYSLFLPNVYTSSVLLSPASEEESLSSRLNQFSGLTSITGVSFSSDAGSKSDEAIARIESFEFFQNYFLPNIKLEDLMALKKWIPEENTLIYDKKKYDENTKKWVRNISYPKKKKPTDLESFVEGYQKILNITQDKDTGFIKISIEHLSPFIAQKWLDIVVFNINESMREQDKKNAQNSIDFLNNSAALNNVKSLDEAISNLLESQMQSLMIASANEAYVFKIIDSSFLPEEKSGPNRPVILFLGTFLGFFISTSIVFLQRLYYFFAPNYKNQN